MEIRIILIGSIILLQVKLIFSDKPCLARHYNHSSIVCVCNSKYCDEISKIKPLQKREYRIYSTSEEGLRFKRTDGVMSEKPPKPDFAESFSDLMRYFVARRSVGATLRIDRNKQYQTIIGFGASFSDATGILYNKLSEGTQKNFIKSYFGEDGIEYNMGRVPIGGTDFSTHPYAYNMEPVDDHKLSNFTLAAEDYLYKIPIIREASRVATNKMLLLASAWSPPIWMKSNKQFFGRSRLLKKYYQTWADYHIRFLEEYEKNNLTFWGISTGNEPSNGNTNYVKFNSLGWSPNEIAGWISDNFGPTIRNSKYKDIAILGLDDMRYCLPLCIAMVAQNKKAFDYVDGIAVHWYWDIYFSPSLVDATHLYYPEKFLINTESSVGILPWIKEKVMLGSWVSGEMYMKFILQDLNHWYVGWIDWNLAVDRVGGPNWNKNYVDATIVMLPERDEFLKQSTYYAMGHFSKFLPRGSRRIHVDMVKGDIDNVAFMRPDGGVVVIFSNPHDTEKTITVYDIERGYIVFHLPKHSFHTLVYW